MQRLNAITIDLEDWYQTQDFKIDSALWSGYEDRIKIGTEIILNLLSLYDIKATFFVLGCVAEKHPALIREIASGGHEIASHGGWHKMVNQMTPEEFRNDLRYSRRVIEDATGCRVDTYRASSWSISSSSLWTLRILEEEGFAVDSSIQPFRTPLSGMKGVPHRPFRPVIGGERSGIVEFPPTVFGNGNLSVPFAGGFYLRFWPYPILSRALAAVNKTGPALVYVHPWEMDAAQPRIACPPHIKLVHYYHLKTTAFKLNKLLQDFRFAPLREVIKQTEFPEAPII